MSRPKGSFNKIYKSDDAIEESEDLENDESSLSVDVEKSFSKNEVLIEELFIVKSLSPNRLFLSNLRWTSNGVLKLTKKELEIPQVKRAIQLNLIKIINE